MPPIEPWEGQGGRVTVGLPTIKQKQKTNILLALPSLCAAAAAAAATGGAAAAAALLWVAFVAAHLF